AWALSFGAHLLAGTSPAMPSAPMRALLWTNLVLLVWRLMVRAAFVGRVYGWREAFWSAPRIFSSNIVALLAARRALLVYVH
ncbi:hypothetical protein, partial [Stenotrophomonas maltophilia]